MSTPVPDLFASMAPALRHQVVDRHARSVVESLTIPGFLEGTPVVQVRAINSKGARCALGSKAFVALSFADGPTFSFAVLALALALAFHSVSGLEKGPSQVVAHELDGLRFLQAVRGLVLKNHIDLARLGAQVQQVLEHVGFMVVVVAILPVDVG